MFINDMDLILKSY